MALNHNKADIIETVSDVNKNEEILEITHNFSEELDAIHLKPPEKNSHMTTRHSSTSRNSIEAFLREFPSNEADFTAGLGFGSL